MHVILICVGESFMTWFWNFTYFRFLCYVDFTLWRKQHLVFRGFLVKQGSIYFYLMVRMKNLLFFSRWFVTPKILNSCKVYCSFSLIFATSLWFRNQIMNKQHTTYYISFSIGLLYGPSNSALPMQIFVTTVFFCFSSDTLTFAYSITITINFHCL
jgi:hypothetical protein